MSKRIESIGAENNLFKKYQVLDHGHIMLIDYMGNDRTIAMAARVSYNNKDIEATEEKDAKLINYLMKHHHTSPFEHVIMSFECKMPIFVAREWVRHRTARLNEVSGRYTQLPEEFYTPSNDRIQAQSKRNKQASEGEISQEIKDTFLSSHRANVKSVFYSYNQYVENGIAREVSRIDLPLSTYTSWVWQMDLHNLFHFLKLRMGEDAQWEIRQYANAIAKVVEESYPVAYKAFADNYLNTVTIPLDEYERLKSKR